MDEYNMIKAYKVYPSDENRGRWVAEPGIDKKASAYTSLTTVRLEKLGELERVFIAMALKCCPVRLTPSLQGKDCKTHGLLLTSSQDEFIHDSLDAAATLQHASSGHWETLEHYHIKYKSFHPRLPLIVAGTLLSADSQIELPLWLVQHFKGDHNGSSFGMSGNESNPASLFRLYVDYGRYTDAINLLIEHMGTLASVRPADVIRRKRSFPVWFPYTSIEHLWYQLEESIKFELSQKISRELFSNLFLFYRVIFVIFSFWEFCKNWLQNLKTLIQIHVVDVFVLINVFKILFVLEKLDLCRVFTQELSMFIVSSNISVVVLVATTNKSYW